MNFFVDLFPVALLGLCLYKLKSVGNVLNETNDEYLSLQTCNCLRGIFAIVVVLHHLAQRTESGFLLPYFNKVGVISVGVFFFFSGYGLQKQYLKNGEKYRKNFLIKRLPSVIIPYAFFNVLYWILYAVGGNIYSVKEIICDFLNGHTLVSFSWYIVVIVEFYLFFFLFMLICKSNHFAMIVCTVIWFFVHFVLCIKMGFGSWWYASAHILPVGMFWATYEDAILKIIKKHYWLCFLASVFGFVTSIGLPKISGLMKATIISKCLMFVLPFLEVIFFVLIVLMTMLKFKMKNAALEFLGKISLEVYLAQGIFMKCFRTHFINIESDVIYVIACIIATVVFAWIMHYIDDYALRKYKKLIK